MATVYEDDCVGCDYCINCGKKHAKYYICDECKEYVDDLYEYDGEELCIDCVKERLPRVE